eukprot:TRINITY_DN10672_c0_g1_i4.p1 TRINITY_DN10672_c0_g1~~TRINITY_DN10672_c0_g1_i4.p1  ORF type:complete len:174 (+),score=35.10 TRINITY_DN10672_c0_g1_i4:190-711(+)
MPSLHGANDSAGKRSDGHEGIDHALDSSPRVHAGLPLIGDDESLQLLGSARLARLSRRVKHAVKMKQRLVEKMKGSTNVAGLHGANDGAGKRIDGRVDIDHALDSSTRVHAGLSVIGDDELLQLLGSARPARLSKRAKHIDKMKQRFVEVIRNNANEFDNDTFSCKSPFRISL